MTVESLAAWLFAAMVSWSPPAQHREGARVASERYRSIAHDFAAVALDEHEPVVFDGPQGRPQTALLLAAIAASESSYRADVDSGQVKGDHGKSWCILQVQVYGKTAENWTGEEIVADRKKCIRVALHRMKESFLECKALPLVYRLAGYTAGTCFEDPKAEYRTRRALSWWKTHPFLVLEDS